jgi:hypothetical protein
VCRIFWLYSAYASGVHLTEPVTPTGGHTFRKFGQDNTTAAAYRNQDRSNGMISCMNRLDEIIRRTWFCLLRRALATAVCGCGGVLTVEVH